MRSAPVGRAFAGAHFVLWCPASDLLGVSLHGRPEEGDVVALLQVLERPPPALAAPCDCIFDARRVSGVDLDVFERYQATLRARATLLRDRVARLALVRPDGLTGAIVAGVSSTVDPRLPAAVFGSLAEAVAWLGRPPALAQAVDALVSPIADGDPLRARLLAAVMASPADVDLVGTARRLGLSPRSLQRALARLGTAFRDEVEAARFALACRLLVESDAKLEAIARRIGLGPAQLTTLFRRRAGVTPSAWRATRRA
jgi:AraC-like DNA-binding protein